MNAVLDVRPEERIPLAFVTAVAIGHLRQGTREHREIAEGLGDIYTSLLDAPDGPVQLEFSNDELYMIGVRLYADATELEDWWLDNRASLRALQERAPFPDDNFGRAVARFYPEVVDDPQAWAFESVRGIFQALGRKIDAVMREAAPRVRGLYNKERAGINRRTLQTQRDRRGQRSRRYSIRLDQQMWRPLLRADALAAGDMTTVVLDGRKILIANTGDGFFAIDAVCTHVPALALLADLSKGQLDAERRCVTCPWHGAQYDLATGKVLRQPYAPEFNREHLFAGRITGVLDPNKTATDTRVYPTKVDGGHVMVDIA